MTTPLTKQERPRHALQGSVGDLVVFVLGLLGAVVGGWLLFRVFVCWSMLQLP